MSYASAETIAAEYPQYSTQITAAAKESFLAGDQYAYIAGIIFVLLGAVLVFFMYPKKDEEQQAGWPSSTPRIWRPWRAGGQAAPAACERRQVSRDRRCRCGQICGCRRVEERI